MGLSIVTVSYRSNPKQTCLPSRKNRNRFENSQYKVFCRSVLSFPVPNFKDHYNLSRQKASMPSLNCFLLHLKKNNDKETDVIAAKVAMVDLVVELNLPLSTSDRINKVFKKSLRIQTLLKAQLKMFFLVLSSSFLCLLFFFSDIRGRHVCQR